MPSQTRCPIVILLALLCTVLSGSQTYAQAVTCSNPDPVHSPIWQAFTEYVQDNYVSKRPYVTVADMEYGALSFGHAYGRLASAVGDDPVKREAFECVGDVLRERFSLRITAYRSFQFAAMGGEDARVKETSGVTDTSPLHVVFSNAYAIAGQTNSGGGSSGTTGGGTSTSTGGQGGGTIIKADPASMFGTSSTAPSVAGVNEMCTTGDRWSLSTARGYLTAASVKRSGLSGTCVKSNWTTCRAIENDLLEARDHIFQVFDQNHDGIANCRLCNYGAAQSMAKELIDWEKWLHANYYNASGLSTIYYTIGDNSTDPLCKLPVPTTAASSAGSATGSGAASAGAAATSANPSALHACADSSVPAVARWKFYRTALGGGGTSYAEKDGMICYGRNTYWTYAGSMEEYKCVDSWQDCKRSAAAPYTYTNVKTDGGVTTYEYEGGWGVRTPEEGAAPVSNTPQPVNTSSNEPSDDQIAQQGSENCASANLKQGKEWAVATNFSYSRYYLHNGYLCAAGGGSVLKVDGTRIRGYVCADKDWQSCKRNTRYDAEVQGAPERSELGGKPMFKQKFKWEGMVPRDVYIER